MNHRGHRSTLRKLSLWLIPLILILAGGGLVLHGRLNKSNDATIASTEVKLKDFVDYVELRGEISVRASTMISAPYNTGDLQILKLPRDGAQVKKGDVIVEFDPTTLLRTAEQLRSALKQVEAEIARLNAQQLLSDEQNLTELMSAKFSLERARLDAGTSEVISAIENEKNALALGKAEQKLKELEAKSETRRIGTEADLAGIMRRREKARADLEQAERNLEALTLTSPIDGIITLLPNSRARTSILGGGTTPVFKEGDRVWAGAAIAEVPDMTSIQAIAPVSEADRGRVQPGQPVMLQIEAVPDREHKGVVNEISALARADYSSYPIRKSFDLTVRLENSDPRLRAGMTAAFRVEVERLHNSIVVPAESVFERVGRMVAYVLEGDGYKERPIGIARRGSSQVMISHGLKPGERIALKDPTLTAEDQK